MTAELIERFFNKQCTAGEAKEVAAYLKVNPDVLEKYLSIYEWNSLAENDMPEEFWNGIWHSIQEKSKAKIISLRLKQAAIAACIILLAGASYYYLNSSKENIKPLAHKYALPKQQRKTVANATKKMMTIILEDSSVIKLSPASVVQYDDPFPENTRDITLEGEAIFHVAKNKKKPFTVYSGALATTALGTIFSIRKKSGKNIVTVKLFQGKVIIHSRGNNLKGWKQDVYLVPGEELKFNEERAMFAIGKMDSTDKAIATIKVNKQYKPDSVNNQLTFSNTLLPEVMNKLSAFYKVNIKYDTLLINTMNFTGTITRNDSLPVILKAIAQMNNLEISENDNNEFMISKHE